MTARPSDTRIDRRQALKRLGAAGAIAWTVPVIQAIDMPKAMARSETGSAPPQGCGNARVSLGGACVPPNFTSGGCGGISCLSGANPSGPSGCGSIASASAADGADWVICVAAGCEVTELSMASAGACWSGPGAPDCGGDASFDWIGFSVSGDCVTIHRPTALNAAGHPVTHNISHVDLVICCAT
jgi:hypothetical protein